MIKGDNIYTIPRLLKLWKRERCIQVAKVVAYLLSQKVVIENKLKAGDDVILNVGKKQIVILPKMTSRSKKVGEIDTSNLSSDFLIRMIISHYLAGLRIR